MRSALDGTELPNPGPVRRLPGARACRRSHQPRQEAAAEHRQTEEDEVVAVLLRLADPRTEQRSHAERLIEGHAMADRLPALKSLARARGVDLERVVRHFLRGELRTIVEFKAVTTRKEG